MADNDATLTVRRKLPMNAMRNIFTIFILTLISQTIFGQSQIRHNSELTKVNSQLITRFWIDFKAAINSKNKAKLASLIKFPFNCDYCMSDELRAKGYNYVMVTRHLFDKGQYKIFFDGKLKRRVNKTSNLLDILTVRHGNNISGWEFSYVSVEPSKDWGGQQHFFSLENNNGRILITSASTVP